MVQPLTSPPAATEAFADLVGQPQAVELMLSALRRDRIAPAYLFAGPAGVGRSLAALSFAERLLASDPHQPFSAARQQRIAQRNHPDFLWIEPTYLHQGKRLSAAEAAAQGVKRRSPPQIRLEQIRAIATFLSRPPLEAPRAVVVLDDAHTMAEAAANGLLKTLEEPGRATLILIAPSIESLLPTLVSRCQRIPFRRLSSEDLAQVLTRLGQTEILQHPEILALAQGSPGEAIAQWQQLQAISPDLLQETLQVPTSLRAALELARKIDQNLDLEAQLWLVDYLQQAYWRSHQPAVYLERLEAARRHLLGYVQPRLVWEVTLMDIAAAR
ncbi:MAG: DNA polymerase III subunit delta' [Cyanobacteria bacterium J069]|nr:MAG: DNA polymerase III subunit delta' [Cyanobacteria bacterium J069]